ncbi:MAG: hypothetical protein U5K31_14510 [Balneolaceae bacterium]|nr:hypothetical protein [Balneolaceae bacterium]
MELERRISYLAEACENWLHEENAYLQEAVERTVDEGYFSLPDVRNALQALRRSCTPEGLRTWVERAGLEEGHAPAPLTLCLHAGNLPLVGMQDALAVLLGGGRYSGKISRKDPYLMPTFLNEVKKTAGWNDRQVQWTHRLSDFEGMAHEAVLFAGSERSVPPVRRAVEEGDMASRDARFLVRTAGFSLAWVDRRDPRVMEDLTEAVFRYGGMGCRSVAVVVAPWPLDEIKCEWTDYIESFWLENPQYLQPGPALRHRFAYNKAVERPQAWLDHFLVQEGGLELDRDFICYWVQGDEETVADLAGQFGPRLQSVYLPHPEAEVPGWAERSEYLTDAQSPPLHWKPDGTDPLRWLTRQA